MMSFRKMHGLGNDFVVVEAVSPTPEQISAWCDRRRGIGADGVLLVDPTPTMTYWNADGSLAEMCGNGLRCVARYAVDRGWAPEYAWFEVKTAVGSRRARVEGEQVTVEVGPVELGEMVSVNGREYRRASVGNPHAVTLVDDPETVDVTAVGSAVSADETFPAGANVEFVKIEGTGQIRLRVWERGVGETLACGSGMVVAAAVAAVHAQSEEVSVTVPGGRATVFFENGSAYLVGPAITTFEGTWLGD